MPKEIRTVDDLIDLKIIDYIKHIQRFSFSQANTMIKQMEIAHARLMSYRTALDMAQATWSPEEVKVNFNKFIGTYVVEKEIMNRIDLLQNVKTLKGVKMADSE